MPWGETTKVESKKEETPKLSTEDKIRQIKEKLMNKNKASVNKLTCGIFSTEGTGKSGIALQYIAKKLTEDKNSYAKVIDLDNGFAELMQFYPEDIQKRCFVSNPIVFKQEVNNDGKNDYKIDYVSTLNNIKEDIYGIKELMNNNCNEFKILAIDGLTQLLKICEYQMKMEKHIQADGGTQMLYWKRRNQMFSEIMEFSKALPIDVFFIGHDDFLRNSSGELSSIKQQMLAMCHQIIEPIKKKEMSSDKITFYSRIHKSKFNILEENKKYVFAEKDGNNYWFDIKDMFDNLKNRKSDNK